MRTFTGSRNSIRQQDVKLTGSPDVFAVLEAAGRERSKFQRSQDEKFDEKFDEDEKLAGRQVIRATKIRRNGFG
jgi:hypothetical protein